MPYTGFPDPNDLSPIAAQECLECGEKFAIWDVPEAPRYCSNDCREKVAGDPTSLGDW